jgi:hypothetical protein
MNRGTAFVTCLGSRDKPLVEAQNAFRCLSILSRYLSSQVPGEIKATLSPLTFKMKPSQESYVPSYADFIVEFHVGDYNSLLRTKKVSKVPNISVFYLLTFSKAFDAGDFLVKFEGLTSATKTYTSVQCGRGSDDHFELNSDLVYSN